MTRNQEMYQAFLAFNIRRPEVWQMFHRFAMEKINAGFKHYSVNGIFERIRWETDVWATGPDQFKIGNNHRPFYARRWMDHNPEYSGFFRIRYQSSKLEAAFNASELGPLDFPYELHIIPQPFSIEDFL